MTAEASFVRESRDRRVTVDAAVASGEIWQMKDGRAAYMKGLNAAASGDVRAFETSGQVVIPKTSGIVILNGGRVYWDHSANAGHYKKVNDRDFYIGRAVGNAASADTEMTVDINVDPPYDIDLVRDPFLSVLAGTPAAGGFGYPARLGGAAILELTSTNEAQKVDLMSVDGFDVTANPIIEFAFRVLSDGGSGSQDFSIGVASGTHATDFQSVANFIAFHLDGNVTDILAESDDATTDLDGVDTTKDYVEGSAVANRIEGWIDMSDPADAQLYINAVNVNPASAFTAGITVGTILFLIAHLEKASGSDVYKIAVDWFRARFGQQ